MQLFKKLYRLYKKTTSNLRKLYSICLIAILALNTIKSEAKIINSINHYNNDDDREVKNFHAVSSGGSFGVIVKMECKSISLEGDQQDLR
jgi:hypothetical protein